MKQNESNLKTKNYHHENTLLRYEINRISTHNEQLIALLSHPQPNFQPNLQHCTKYDNPQESIILHDES